MSAKKTVAFYTLGCRLNFSESGELARGFVDRGYKIVNFGETADVSFINTCTVTDDADSSCRNIIRKAHRVSPGGKVVVAGCYAQMDAKKIAKMQGVDLVLGTSEKYRVFDYLREERSNAIHIDKTDVFWGANSSLSDGKTRAFLKIQDGCNYICSFCIIPFARGRSRSISIKQALAQATKLVDRGLQEIVLTGVNIGEYTFSGHDRLEDLVGAILELPKLKRLRLSSVEPNTISDELLAILQASPKFLQHFHIPMQSGDDEILSKMRRKYDVKFYRDVIGKIKLHFPRCAIGADMIAGFPGETNEQFENTYQLARDLPLTHFHVFPYSKRALTSASKLPGHIPHHVKKERVKRLISLGDKKLFSFANSFIGETNDVLFEKKNKEGFYTGYTTNFIRAKVLSSIDLTNKIVPVKLIDVSGDHYICERARSSLF